jgi:hypothetical protein
VTLLDKCAVILGTLNQVEIARRNASQRAAVDQRVREWADCSSKMERARERARLIDLTDPQAETCRSEWKKARELAAAAAERLAETGDASSLSKDALWTQLLASARAAAESTENAISAAWQIFVQEHEPVESAAAVRGRLSLTPENEKTLRDYEAVHTAYSRLKSQAAPRTANDRQDFLDALAQCREVFERFHFDVPSEVDAFFKAVNSGGASLELLTPVVMQWLRANHQLERYIIRSLSR